MTVVFRPASLAEDSTSPRSSLNRGSPPQITTLRKPDLQAWLYKSLTCPLSSSSPSPFHKQKGQSALHRRVMRWESIKGLPRNRAARRALNSLVALKGTHPIY